MVCVSLRKDLLYKMDEILGTHFIIIYISGTSVVPVLSQRVVLLLLLLCVCVCVCVCGVCE